MPPLRHAGPDQVARRSRQVFFPGDTPCDFRKTAVVESDVKPEMPAIPLSAKLRGEASCQIVADQPQRVEIDADMKQPGLLVVNDLFYPGWYAEVTSADGRRTQVPILRTNRIMRGVVLPAGKHRVAFVYRPPLFYAGAAMSVAAWLALGLGSKVILRNAAILAHCLGQTAATCGRYDQPTVEVCGYDFWHVANSPECGSGSFARILANSATPCRQDFWPDTGRTAR